MNIMNVLIVEDDPMVQFIHRNYIEKLNAFNDIYSCMTVPDAEHLISSKKIELILLDINLKIGNGFDFLCNLRKDKNSIEIILITAYSDSKLVGNCLHMGILDYLIKPFTFERFKESISLFQQKNVELSAQEISQTALDRLLLPFEKNPLQADTLDKGMTEATLDLVYKTLKRFDHPFTIQELVQASGLSHVSVRKYVSFLEKRSIISSQIVYLNIGRPYKKYLLN